MIRPPRPGDLRVPLAWCGAAVLLWLAAAAVDRRTELVVESLGEHLRLAVAGSELVVPGTLGPVRGLTVWAADSIDRPALVRWRVADAGGARRLAPPERDPWRDGGQTPVGDWWVDERCELRPIAADEVALDGSFELTAELRGRFSRELVVALESDPPVRLGLRRGLKDSYLVVRRDDLSVVDAVTLDPTPAADLGALLAQLLRALAAGCVAIAVVVAASALGPRPAAAPAPPDPVAVRARWGRLAVVSALALAVAAAALSAWAATSVLGGLPHQIDEVVYLLQARWLLDGEVAPAVSAIQPHLRVPFTYLVEGRWVGHYPAGWPALLAAGLAAGAPSLVNPLLGGALVLLVFAVGRSLDDELTGLAAAGLAAVSPLLRLLSASLFPHIAFAALCLVAVWGGVVARRRPGWRPGALIGIAMGCCLALRPMPAVAVSLVLGGWLIAGALRDLRRPAAWAAMAAAVVTGLVAALPTLAHNAAVTGSPFALPYSLAAGAMYDPALVPFGLRNLDAILATASAGLTGWGWPLTTSAFALALPLGLAAVPFLLGRARPEDRLLLAILVVVALAHLPTRAHGLHGYGARYLVDVAPCLLLLAARGARELARRAAPSRIGGPAIAALLVALGLAALAALPHRLGLYRGYDGVTGELERRLEATGAASAVVLVDDASWQPWAEGARLMTGPRRRDVVVAADLGDNSSVLAAHPDRPVFLWDGRTLEVFAGGPE